MNKTVELVNAWAAYEATHPEGSLEDFYRFCLVRGEERDPEGKAVGGIIPHSAEGFFLKLFGRISQMLKIYEEIAVREAGMNQVEEFMLLSNIDFGNPRKTELVYAAILELSTGTNILNKLLAEGYIVESVDEEDKRSKRIALTEKGEKVLVGSRRNLVKIGRLLLNEMTADELRLCIQLLKGLEIKLAGQWQRHKGLPFGEVCAEMEKGTLSDTKSGRPDTLS
jgi:DNA-binding MarR family transcriptional regulator